MPMTIAMTVVRGMDRANWLKLGMTMVGTIMPHPPTFLIPGGCARV